MKKRTDNEIREQIELLRLQREAIPASSAFGDDNHCNIDKQIAVLVDALAKDELDLDDAREDSYDDARLAAFDWVLGDTDDPLVEADDNWVKKARARRKAR